MDRLEKKIKELIKDEMKNGIGNNSPKKPKREYDTQAQKDLLNAFVNRHHKTLKGKNEKIKNELFKELTETLNQNGPYRMCYIWKLVIKHNL